jgi:hypothetical protein
MSTTAKQSISGTGGTGAVDNGRKLAMASANAKLSVDGSGLAWKMLTSGLVGLFGFGEGKCVENKILSKW